MNGGLRRVGTGVLCAILGAVYILIGCRPVSHDSSCIKLEFQTINGVPADSLWILPTNLEGVPFSWWSQGGYEILGDTLWTDQQGQLIFLLHKNSPVKGLKCGGGPDSLPSFFLPWPSELVEQDQWLISKFQIPTPVWYNLVGNRNGLHHDTLFYSLAIESGHHSSIDEGNSWFTPGQPPRPNALIKFWVHPNEEIHICRDLILWNHHMPSMRIELCPESFQLRDTIVKNL